MSAIHSWQLTGENASYRDREAYEERQECEEWVQSSSAQ